MFLCGIIVIITVVKKEQTDKMKMKTEEKEEKDFFFTFKFSLCCCRLHIDEHNHNAEVFLCIELLYCMVFISSDDHQVDDSNLLVVIHLFILINKSNRKR